MATIVGLLESPHGQLPARLNSINHFRIGSVFKHRNFNWILHPRISRPGALVRIIPPHSRTLSSKSSDECYHEMLIAPKKRKLSLTTRRIIVLHKWSPPPDDYETTTTSKSRPETRQMFRIVNPVIVKLNKFRRTVFFASRNLGVIHLTVVASSAASGRSLVVGGSGGRPARIYRNPVDLTKKGQRF